MFLSLTNNHSMKTKLNPIAAAALCLAISPVWAIAQGPNPPPPPPAPPLSPSHEPDAHGDHHEDVPEFRRRVPREDRRGAMQRQLRREMEPQPYLGVITQSAPPALSTQLGLPEGFGLLVEEVMPGSPAEKAGLQKHDLLKLLNDQQLMSSEQLARLVEAAGKDADVQITLLRKGQEQKVTAKIVEEPRPVRRPMGRGGRVIFPEINERSIEEGIERLKESVREQQEKVQEMQERTREEIDKTIKKAQEFAAEVLPEDVLKEFAPGASPKVRVFSNTASSTWDTGKARVVLKDNDGEVEVNLENGKRTMIAKDPAGKVVFEGPIDTEEQRKAVPALFRKKLDQIQVQVDGSHAEAHASPPTAPKDPAEDKEAH